MENKAILENINVETALAFIGKDIYIYIYIYVYSLKIKLTIDFMSIIYIKKTKSRINLKVGEKKRKSRRIVYLPL